MFRPVARASPSDGLKWIDQFTVTTNRHSNGMFREGDRQIKPMALTKGFLPADIGIQSVFALWTIARSKYGAGRTLTETALVGG